MQAAGELLESEFLGGLDEAGRRAAQATLDLEAEENACPACGAAFAKVPARCPSCGLRLLPQS